MLDVQRPYRWNLERCCSGRVLKVGCGIGWNLGNPRRLPVAPVGVDPNPESIRVAREEGFQADTFQDFASAVSAPEGFDTPLLNHVLEHATFEECSP